MLKMLELQYQMMRCGFLAVVRVNIVSLLIRVNIKLLKYRLLEYDEYC